MNISVGEWVALGVNLAFFVLNWWLAERFRKVSKRVSEDLFCREVEVGKREIKHALEVTERRGTDPKGGDAP